VLLPGLLVLLDILPVVKLTEADQILVTGVGVSLHIQSGLDDQCP